MPVVVRGGSANDVHRVDSLLRRHLAVFPLGPANERAAGTEPLEIRLAGAAERPVSGRLIVETQYLRVLGTRTGFSLQTGESSVEVEPSRSIAVGRLSEHFWDQPVLAQRDLFLQALVILLRDRRIYGLHAGGVERDGVGLLVVGPSGRGKTTLIMSLIAAGWRFLGDDVVALRRGQEAVEALAVRRSMSCTSTTLALFGLGSSDGAGGGKHLVDVASGSADGVIDRFHPGLIVFPEVADRAHSELTPLEEPATVADLGLSMAGIMTDATWAERQLGVLARLADQAPGYRLLVGRDVHEDPPAVSRLLLEAGSAR